ncbi:MAG TPA: hypothetical protein VHY83_15030 [Solirubrobacteraceae bacterium]|jgi:hypothetical protein|nr:hypothetical protein [Solirubrobacteraceae bacterium]
MTTKADFTSEEWDLVREGPPSAGMIVITAQRGGSIRETFSMGKAYAEARQRHGQSELLDELVSARPEVDHTRYGSPDEFRQHALQHVRDAVALLEGKAEPQELADYRGFVVSLAERVARAHSEGEDPVSDAEQQAIDDIRGALG